MSERGIFLSPQHGVNPSMMQCFYCMKDHGLVLFGRLRGDQEAPRQVCLDKEPCDECKKHMETGVILISVDASRSDDPQNPYRTGGWVVITEDAIRRIVKPKELSEDICRRRMAFVPDDAWDKIGLPRGEQSGKDGS